jgi:preprotein translocase subunit SecD
MGILPRLAAGPARAQSDRIVRSVRFTAGDIRRATHGTDAATAAPRVLVRLSDDAATRLREFTRAHVGKFIEIRVDGRVVSRPKILEPNSGSEFVISGNFTAQEARAMAAAFGAGTAMVEFEVAD